MLAAASGWGAAQVRPNARELWWCGEYGQGLAGDPRGRDMEACEKGPEGGQAA